MLKFRAKLATLVRPGAVARGLAGKVFDFYEGPKYFLKYIKKYLTCTQNTKHITRFLQQNVYSEGTQGHAAE